MAQSTRPTPNHIWKPQPVPFSFISIAKGVNEGWLSHIYGSAALAGWNALATKVTESAKCAILWKVQRLLMIMFIILIEVKAVPPIFTEP